MTKVKNPSGDACHPDGSYSFSVAVDCLVWAISPDANPRITGSTGVAIAEGWQDATLPLMEQVYQASTLDPALERERLTGALEEAANEFRRYSKRFAAGAQKKRRLFSIFTRTCFRTPGCVANCLPRLIKARWQSGR